MLTKLVRNTYFLQNLATWLVMRVPPPIHHNVAKLAAIRKAFAYTELEKIGGDYIEFGVYQGNSLIGAINAHRFQSGFYNERTPCRFIGCDSFEGLVPNVSIDGEHPNFDDRSFLATSYERVMRRIDRYRRHAEIHIVKGYFAETLPSDPFRRIGVSHLRIILLDCDLKSSTADALRHSAPFWQPGMVLIFDDYYSYKGDESAGEHGAFVEFCAAHPGYRFREFGHYGFNGHMKIVTAIPSVRG
ncbi:MAG: hypothetical protein EXQ48_03895 [Acidobacteria bacterium]|nr:hypothetical protein [Acidobacteriota bacterium]